MLKIVWSTATTVLLSVQNKVYNLADLTEYRELRKSQQYDYSGY